MGAAGWQPVNEERRQQWFDKVIHRLTDKKCDHKFVDSNVCLKCGWKAMSEPIPLSAFFTRLGIRARVMEFHEAMGVPILHRPQVPDDDRVRLRLNLIAEEFFETLAAALGESHVHYAKTLVMAAIKYVPINVNLPEFIDGLCDLDYVNEGTRLEFGVNGIPVLDEVHAANMRKIDGPIREDGKRMKPPGWTPPDIERVLVEQGWRK
jgi:predicted HAD superfamily Cof-like phosphohydrolase